MFGPVSDLVADQLTRPDAPAMKFKIRSTLKPDPYKLRFVALENPLQHFLWVVDCAFCTSLHLFQKPPPIDGLSKSFSCSISV